MSAKGVSYGVDHGLRSNAFRAKVLQYLSELQPAPSVGLQDVPRESVGEHLGFGSLHETEPMDELDEQLARMYQILCHGLDYLTLVLAEHTRFVYDLQEATAEVDSDEDDAESLSDDSSTGRRHRTSRHARGRGTRKRMSILTNRYYDVPRPDEHGEEALPDLCAGTHADGARRGGRRRFFQSAARWDPVAEKVLVEWDAVRSPRVGVAAAMASPGRDWLARNGYGYGGGGEEGEQQEEAIDEEMEVDEEEEG